MSIDYYRTINLLTGLRQNILTREILVEDFPELKFVKEDLENILLALKTSRAPIDKKFVDLIDKKYPKFVLYTSISTRGGRTCTRCGKTFSSKLLPTASEKEKAESVRQVNEYKKKKREEWERLEEARKARANEPQSEREIIDLNLLNAQNKESNDVDPALVAKTVKFVDEQEQQELEAKEQQELEANNL